MLGILKFWHTQPPPPCIIPREEPHFCLDCEAIFPAKSRVRVGRDEHCPVCGSKQIKRVFSLFGSLTLEERKICEHCRVAFVTTLCPVCRTAKGIPALNVLAGALAYARQEVQRKKRLEQTRRQMVAQDNPTYLLTNGEYPRPVRKVTTIKPEEAA